MKPLGDVLSLCTTVSSPDPAKTAATNEHRSERSEQLDRAPVARAPEGPLRERRRARAEECRSDKRNTRGQHGSPAQLRRVFREA